MSRKTKLTVMGLMCVALLEAAIVPVSAQPCILHELERFTGHGTHQPTEFGSSVCISGNRAIVGAHDDAWSGHGPGQAIVFRGDDNGTPQDPSDDSWTRDMELLPSDPVDGDQFGFSVAIDQQTAVVGVLQDYSRGPGLAYVFRHDDNGTPLDPSDDLWVEEGILTASDGETGDLFGRSVSISGDYVVVGAQGDRDAGWRSGAAYVFRRDRHGTPGDPTDDFWVQEAKLAASDAAEQDYFGGSVAISGDRVIVGAAYNDQAGQNSGAAYVFHRDDNGTPVDLSDDTWIEQGILVASDAGPGDSFGRSVSISGDHAVVGAPFSGTAYVFRRDDNPTKSGSETNDDAWLEVARLTNPDGEPSGWFGDAVSISEDQVLVGASRVGESGSDGGAAYLFRRDDNGTPGDPSDDIWLQAAKLVLFYVGNRYHFGEAVSINGDRAVIGAPSDNGGMHGRAYVFAVGEDCFTQVCGDGMVARWEYCDDGNVVDGDGCSSACIIEDGWDCPGQPSTCTFVCGNGIINWGSEICDDGNVLPGDGCNEHCRREGGWMCSGEPSVCRRLGPGPEMRWDPVTADGNVVCTPGVPPCAETEIVLSRGGVTVTLFLEVSGWDSDYDGSPSLIGYNAELDTNSLLGGDATGDDTLPGFDLIPVGSTTGMGAEGVFHALNVCTDDLLDPDVTDPVTRFSRCDWAGDCPVTHPFCVERPDFVFHAQESSPSVSTYHYMWSAFASQYCVADGRCSGSGEQCDDDVAAPPWVLGCPSGQTCEEPRFYAGTFLVDVPIGARGTYHVSLVLDWWRSTLYGCSSWEIGTQKTAGQITIQTGLCCSDIGVESTVCEDGLTVSECDARPGPRAFMLLETCDAGTDCNDNGIPDECDTLVADCNHNGLPDDCEPDSDDDSVIDGCDGCPNDPNKVEPGICGCGREDNADSDSDGVPDCNDQCHGVDDTIFAPGCIDAVPTLSEWGLVVMTLLLLTGLKITFAGRQAKRA